MYIEGDLPVSTGYNNNGGFFGNGDGIWAILLFAMIFGWGNNGNGFGGGFGGGYGAGLYDVNANTNRGFDNLAIHNELDEVQSTLTNGFTNIANSFTNLATNFQNCCCENKLGIADLKYTVATENCADRQALNEGIRDVIASNTANTQAILDKLCQQEIDAKNDQIATLRTQLNMSNLAASQTAQTADIINALRPVAQPAYITCSPFTSYANNGCGCGSIQ